jgi:hypothetical protein
MPLETVGDLAPGRKRVNVGPQQQPVVRMIIVFVAIWVDVRGFQHSEQSASSYQTPIPVLLS